LADTAAFLTALLDGRVVPQPQLNEMTRTVPWPENGPEFDYGLGIGSIALPCGVTVWGHGGDIDGYHSVVAKPVGGTTASMTFTQSPQSESFADDPRAAILDAAYC
jgi:D-alanyl-D-alanine carboxypeptidase